MPLSGSPRRGSPAPFPSILAWRCHPVQNLAHDEVRGRIRSLEEGGAVEDEPVDEYMARKLFYVVGCDVVSSIEYRVCPRTVYQLDHRTRTRTQRYSAVFACLPGVLRRIGECFVGDSGRFDPLIESL